MVLFTVGEILSEDTHKDSPMFMDYQQKDLLDCNKGAFTQTEERNIGNGNVSRD